MCNCKVQEEIIEFMNCGRVKIFFFTSLASFGQTSIRLVHVAIGLFIQIMGIIDIR